VSWHIEPVNPAAVAEHWPLAARHLKRAVDRSEGRWDMRALFRACRVGAEVLWLIYDDEYRVAAAFTTRVAKYPRKAILTVTFLGGNGMRGWLPFFLGALDRYVADAGLDGLEAYGRAGWSRLLQRFGWQQSFVGVSKSAEGPGALS
jgi:hypothetical protein